MSDASVVGGVQIWGITRGTEFSGAGALRADDTGIAVTFEDGRELRTGYASLDGLRSASGHLALFVRGGDVIEVEGSPRLTAAAREIALRACALPEQTLALRGLGSRRGRPGDEHDRFFAPLLAARRKADRAGDVAGQLAAFDAPPLGAAITGTLREAAAARFPRSAPDRRATEAILFETAAPLFARLDALDVAARAFREAPDDARFSRWRDWAAALTAVFAEADRCWLAAAPALGEDDDTDTPSPPSRWRRLLRLGFAFAVLAPARHALEAQHGVLKVSGVRAESLLARGFDVVEARPGYVLVVANRAEERALRAFGAAVSDMRTPATQRFRAGLAAVATPTVYRSFDDPARGIAVWLDSVARNNALVHLDTIGFSYEGRPMLAVKIGAAGDAPDRPNVLFMATYHAREWAATEMALRLIRYLAQSPAPNARVDSLVNRRDIRILPVANPDGYQYTFDVDRLWRKNRRPITATDTGVDLNRNHSADWAYDDYGSSPDPASEIYRGPSPASEPEVQAIDAFHAAHPPVVSVSYHTYTGLLLYPPGYAYGLLPADLGIYRTLAGTDEDPAVRDNLPSPERDHYHPAPSWNLYTTNGEYGDWTSSAYGTISFTPELTSGYEGGIYYGFEFPDDEARLETVFEDNLPFALSVLESAADPFAYRSPVTGLRSETIALETVTPNIRVRVPAADAAATVIRTSGPLAVVADTAGGAYTRRLTSEPVVRPAQVTVTAGARTALFAVLAGGGGDSADVAWTAVAPATADTGGFGGHQWMLPQGGVLRSPPVTVPADADTVSVLYWTRYDGNGFSLAPHGEIRVSRDGGATFLPEGSVAGYTNTYYPEAVTLTGVAGRSIQIEFAAVGMTWWVDEVAIVAHGVLAIAQTPPAESLAPSENPVRGDRVHFPWPFTSAGDLAVFDFAGREVWRTAVIAGSSDVTWDVAASRTANGAYLVVARSRGRVLRRKLFVARR